MEIVLSPKFLMKMLNKKESINILLELHIPNSNGILMLILVDQSESKHDSDGYINILSDLS